jgi:O-antigen/teichoic acid export membrane protein
MRKQAEQWIVATMFPSAVFGVFSIATTVLMPVEVLRGGLANLLLPKMSQLHSVGRYQELLRLNMQGNVILSVIIFPVVAALFAFSDEVIQFLFTKEYVGGSPVVRIYLVQTLVYSVEITTLLNVFKQGVSNMLYEASSFPFAVLFSFVGISYYGLPGADVGSVLAGVMVYALFLQRLSKVMGIPVARLQDWENLGKICGISIVCALVVRFAADLLKLSTPVSAIGGPGAVLMLYGIFVLATGYYRTLDKLRREWGSMHFV